MIGPTGLADCSNAPELAFNGKVSYTAFLGGNGGGNGAVAVMKFINGVWDTVGVGGRSAAGAEPYLPCQRQLHLSCNPHRDFI